MSTPEHPAGPAEAQLIERQLPRPGETPSASVPTPGLSMAVLRSPTSPTLPDWDVTSLAGAMARAASELFGAPVIATPSIAAPSTIATPSIAMTSAPGGSPFDAPLSFASLDRVPAAPLESFSLVESTPSESPYWLRTAPLEAPAPRAGHKHDPIVPLTLDGAALDPLAVRAEFPILQQRVNGKPLVWLDNAATTQKPRAVIDRLTRFYETENSNIHRAAHTLAARATDAYESARETVRKFVRASSKNDVVFVRGATEGINLVAATWGAQNVSEGDEIVLTWLEHHANIVPWQRLCLQKGARLRIAPVDDRGQIQLDAYAALLGPRTKLVAMPQVSNALGTITPAAEMIAMAHRAGAKVLLDGAQAISHMSVDVRALDCDFYVFSGHKVFAPTGIGAVIGKPELLAAMPPYQGGGNMIADVTFEETRYQGPPARFEAGTGNIADAVGLGAALEWLARVGVDAVGAYEHVLLEYATERLCGVPGLTIIGTAAEKAGVISFVLDGQKTEELSAILDRDGIAVRSGHHCAQPILRRFGLEATVRASFAPYNTRDDIDALVDALMRLQAGRR